MSGLVVVQGTAATPAAASGPLILAGTRMLGPDVLRVLAILLVMAFHLPGAATPPLLQPFRQYGWLGVDIFFVLSGFLIGTQLLAPVSRGGAPAIGAFYRRRAFRILPAFIVVLALYALWPDLRESPALRPLWRFATFTMNFGLDFRVAGAFSNAWSLCVEEHFYLLLPPLILLLRRWSSPLPAILACAGILLLCVMARFLAWNTAVAPAVQAGDGAELMAAYLRSVYYPTWCRLDGLALGVALAAIRLFHAAKWQRFTSPAGLAASGALAVVAAILLFQDRDALGPAGRWMPVLSLWAATFGYSLFALGCTLLLAAMLDLERLRGAPRLAPVAWLATISYSLYLVHKPVMHLDRMWLGMDVLRGWSGLAIYLVTSIAAATLLWAAVERPFLLLRKRWPA